MSKTQSQTVLHLLSLIQPPLYKVMVPQWGDEAHVYVRSLTDEERRKHIQEAKSNIANEATKDKVEDGIREMVKNYTFTSEGEQIFDDENISKVTWDGICHIYYSMTKIWSGIHDFESAKKN